MSDVFSPARDDGWNAGGESEQQIAQTFERASRSGAVLLIDEVDSLLSDRRNAVRSWENSIVNEMLVQIDRFQGVLVACTNLAEHLDQAVLRRFDFKAYLGYLRPAQAWRMFRKAVKALPSRADTVENMLKERICSMSTLTPGDFANVSRQARISGVPATPAAFLEALEREQRAKSVARRGIGFTAVLS